MRSKGLIGGLGRAAWMMLCAAGIVLPVHASGPRFVTGNRGWAVPGGRPIMFLPSNPLYYTDPGDLSAAVSHAQADAMVAAAAATWNVPTSALVLQQGGELAEHVSSANVYFDGSEMQFPADVSSSNYGSIPIAVIYDTDGSVIDTLLGDGASDPSGCRDTGVVESVDMIDPAGYIRHAMLILNGRCVGSAPAQMLQMQYQLERAFGRVIGLAWSQVNDNLFTGATPPSAGAISYWPIMHPIDVLCGPYSYQCITNPFELRIDDLSGLTFLYPLTSQNIMPGKVLSGQDALTLYANVLFPTGQGMDWVNVTVTRQLRAAHNLEPWQVASGVTGYKYEQNSGNAVTGNEGVSEDVGGPYGPDEAEAFVPRVPDQVVINAYMRSEAIDPLYTAEYALAPYQRPPVTPSGSPVTMVDWSAVAGTIGAYSQAAWDAAPTCAPGDDGTQSAPAASDGSGWWTGQLCPVGHSSWWNVQVKAGSSWTLEVTATDETGAPTLYKAQPVIGVWNMGDGGLPTVASAPVALNSLAPGVTQLQMPAGTSPGNYKFVVADQYGGGRPDFTYKARVLYAASVSPAQVSSTGGEIVIAGEGFRSGNQVYVNGTAATVVSLSANEIVARTPTMADAGASLALPVDVMITDQQTGGTTDIASGFAYTDLQPDEAVVVSAPGGLETGVTAATPLVVQMLKADGVTPVVNASVELSVISGAAGFAACGGAASCTVQTDAAGKVSSAVTGGAAGAVVLIATEVSGSAQATISLTDTNPVRAAAITTSASYVGAGASGSWTVSLATTQDGAALAGVPVIWTAGSGVSLSSGSGLTDVTGAATVTVSAAQMSAGSVTVTGCAWVSACASWTVTAVDSSQWKVTARSGAGQSVSAGTALTPVTLSVTDTAGHALEGAAVSIYQTADGWEGACPATGPCAAAPVLASERSTAVSDANGDVTVTPLEVPGLPQVVNIAVVTGTEGFCSMSLPVTP